MQTSIAQNLPQLRAFQEKNVTTFPFLLDVQLHLLPAGIICVFSLAAIQLFGVFQNIATEESTVFKTSTLVDIINCYIMKRFKKNISRILIPYKRAA